MHLEEYQLNRYILILDRDMLYPYICNHCDLKKSPFVLAGMSQLALEVVVGLLHWVFEERMHTIYLTYFSNTETLIKDSQAFFFHDLSPLEYL